VLAGVHFLIDVFASMLPAILPAIRDEFSLSLSQGGYVLVALLLTCNALQPLIGHMRAHKRRPLFLHLGLIVGAGICLLGILPRGSNAFALMILLDSDCTSGRTAGDSLTWSDSTGGQHGCFYVGWFSRIRKRWGNLRLSCLSLWFQGLVPSGSLSDYWHCIDNFPENPACCRAERSKKRTESNRKIPAVFLADNDYGDTCGYLHDHSYITAADGTQRAWF